MCDKLKLYGLDKNAVQWIETFISGRTQKVKIGMKLRESANLVSGVPQGGILSPLLYIIYVADMDKWLEFSDCTTYADDITSYIKCGMSYLRQLPHTMLYTLQN